MPTHSHAGAVAALLFTYFALIGGLSPFLSLYLADAGLSIAQIAVLLSLPQAMRIVGPAFWGWMADRSGRYNGLLRASASANLVLLALLPWAVQSYPGCFVVLALIYFVNSAQGPIGEAHTVSLAGGDAGRYGNIRLWGSVGYLLAVVLIGVLLDTLGMARFPAVLVAMALVLLVVVWRLPAPRWVSASPARSTASVRQRLREPAIAWFFVSAFLMVFGHAALYGFYSLYLEMYGFTKSEIGVFWAIGVVAEILVFRYQAGLFRRFGAPWLLGFSLAVAAVRFGLMAFWSGGLALMFVLQLAHAITFGVHHSASVALLQRWFGADQQARAQALYTTLAYGLGGTLGGLICGLLWSRVGPAACFMAASVACALGLLAAWFSYRSGGAGSS